MMTRVKKLLGTIPGLGRLARMVLSLPITTARPNGHFYSPVVRPKSVLEIEDTVWPAEPPALPGLDFNDRSHRTILEEWFPRHISKYDYPEAQRHNQGPTEFFADNGQFGWLDAKALTVFLCELQPRRLIEIGSGYSSLLIADVNNRRLQNTVEFRCIDP